MRRRGVGSVVVGVVLAVAAVVLTLAGTYPAPLGRYLLLWGLYGAAVYSLVLGVVRIRVKDLGEAPPGVTRLPFGGSGAPGKRSVRCRVLGHRQVFVARTAERPPHWSCRRCGAWSESRLGSGRAWICSLPFTDHDFVPVGATETTPPYWRCVRCGWVRYTLPPSFGETLVAARTLTNWIKHGEDM